MVLIWYSNNPEVEICKEILDNPISRTNPNSKSQHYMVCLELKHLSVNYLKTGKNYDS